MNNSSIDSLKSEDLLDLIEQELTRLSPNSNIAEKIYIKFDNKITDNNDLTVKNLRIRLSNCYYTEVYYFPQLIDCLSNLESASFDCFSSNNIWDLISDCKC